MSRKVLSHMDSAVQGNDFELIPTVRMESQRSIGEPTCHDLSRFVIISEKSRLEVGNCWRWSRFFGEKRPLKGKFSKNYSERIHHVTESHLVCKFREIWLTGNRQSRALFTWQKNNFCKVSRSRFCADRAQNLSGPAPNNKSSQISSNPFTSGEVLAERVNIVETRHKEFPILGEASSPSKYQGEFPDGNTAR